VSVRLRPHSNQEDAQMETIRQDLNISQSVNKIPAPLRDVINRRLDRFVRPRISVLNNSRSSFQVCGCAGLALAILLSIALVTRLDLSYSVLAIIILGGAAAFFGLAMLTKIITGEEQLVYYHHEIAVIIVTAILLRIMGQPILPYLDVAILAVGAFLFCGRIGCLMVGCCYGRIHRWGVCYAEEHAAEGFDSCYVGVRLFPIQAIESLWVFFTVTVGCSLILIHRAPGEAFAWYIVAYDVGRFCFEFLRGDSERRYLLGFSEPQWISFGLLCFVVWAEFAGLLNYHAWHAAAAAAMGLTMIAVFLTRRHQKSIKHRLLNPKHVKAIAEALERLSLAVSEGTGLIRLGFTQVNIPYECTPQGIRISASRVEIPEGSAYLYALSSEKEAMTQREASTLAELILQLKYAGASNELIAGNRGVFHLLIHPMKGR
jgi:hypothetical protein